MKNDSIGRPIETGKLFISAMDETISVGVVEEVGEKPNRYNPQRMDTSVRTRRVRMSGNTVGRPIVGQLQYGSKILLVDSFDFLPLHLKVQVEVALGI